MALFATFVTYGQNLEPFKIQRDGIFLTEEGKNFQVVEFEGKTAQELYDMVLLNAKRMFIPPKDEISENEAVNISIGWLFEIPRGVFKLFEDYHTWEVRCYYTLTFKDGRIKVEAPRMDKYLVAISPTQSNSLLFANAVNYCYKKNGEINPKRAYRLEAFEEGVNAHL